MILELALAIILAKVMDEIFIRIKQPPAIGEILVGVLFSILMIFTPFKFVFLGHEFSFALDLPHDAFDFFAEFGIIILLFLSGMELDIDAIKRSGKAAVMIGGMGVGVTMGIVAVFSFFVLGFSFQQALIYGTIFVATSVGVTARTLMDMGILSSRVGAAILTAAVADDVFGIIAITLVLGRGEMVEVAAGMAIFFAVLYLIYRKNIVERSVKMAEEKLHTPYALVSISIGIMLLFAYFAEISHIAPITGAFFAGLLLGQTREREIVIGHLRTIGYSIFIPVFFVKVGTLMDFSHIIEISPFLLLTIPLVFIGKFAGCSVGARMGGLSWREASMVGIGMMPEMEVALVIATLAYSSGAFQGALGTQVIAITILYVIVSSLIVPLLLKSMRKKIKNFGEY